MKIKREKYTIRPWRKSDAPALARYADNIRVWNNLRDYFPHPYTEKDGEVFIGMILKKRQLEDFAIEIDGHAVGGIGIVPLSDIERYSAEIGYWLAEPFWSQGIMTEVVKDVVDYVWAHTALVRLFAGVFADNTASRRVLEKAGFRLVGVQQKAAFKNGTFVDMPLYELIKKE